MDDPTRPALPTATVDDLFALATYDFPIAVRGVTKVLKLRHLDPLTRFIEDSIPMPLMAAATQVIEKIMRAGGDLDEGEARDAALGDAIAALPGEEMATLREMLWRNAVLVAVEPKLSIAGETPGTFPVRLLDMGTLLRIYNEHPQEELLQAVPGGAAARDFRDQGRAPAAAAGSPGEAVRAEAEQLAPAGVSA